MICVSLRPTVCVSLLPVLSTAGEEKWTDVAYLKPESKPEFLFTQVPGVLKVNTDWAHVVVA